MSWMRYTRNQAWAEPFPGIGLRPCGWTGRVGRICSDLALHRSAGEAVVVMGGGIRQINVPSLAITSNILNNRHGEGLCLRQACSPHPSRLTAAAGSTPMKAVPMPPRCTWSRPRLCNGGSRSTPKLDCPQRGRNLASQRCRPVPAELRMGDAALLAARRGLPAHRCHRARSHSGRPTRRRSVPCKLADSTWLSRV